MDCPSTACPNESSCAVMRRLAGSHRLGVLRAFYCETSSGVWRCERFRQLTSGKEVADDVLPNGRSVEDLVRSFGIA